MLNSAIRLKNSMEAIREKLFTIDEYPFIIRDRLPLDVLDKALKIEALAMPVYAASLGSRQLEALLLDYRGLTSVSAQQKIAAILALRFSKRLLRLIMAIYQYDYNTEAMATLLSAMLNQAHKLQEQPSTGDFIWKFGVTGERYQEIDHFLLQNGKELDRFFADFHINGDSPLADEIKYRYLQHGIKEVLFLNSRHLMHLIEDRQISDIFDLISNYLQVFPLEEYLDGINLAIFEKLGDPYISQEWQPYPFKIRDKFAQWKFLYLLKLRSRKYPNKYKVLSSYYSQVRSSYELEEGRIAVLDFGEIVVVDVLDKSYSLFYYKDVFEAEMAAWQDSEHEIEPAFMKIDKTSISARDYIIEELEDSCMRLSYEGVDTLYIAELLDIQMGLEPDIRSGKGKKLLKN